MTKEYSRKCIATNQVYEINKLIRFSLKEKKEVFLDLEKKMGGRGAYVLNEKQYLEMVFHKKLLNKAFKMNVDKENYQKLEKEVNEIWLKKSKENQI